MNLPTLDEAVERGATPLVSQGFDAHEGSGVSPREIARTVLLAAEWEDLTAEVERLREERDYFDHQAGQLDQVGTYWQAREQASRDLCDKLAEVVQDAYFRAGVNSYETRREIAKAVLALCQERT